MAYQTQQTGLQPAGVELFDVSDPANPRSISFFDRSGPHSQGAHLRVVHGWRIHAHQQRCARFYPHIPQGPSVYTMVDVRNPSKPEEVGRWWLPGTRQGDDVPPPVRHKRLDAGFRTHNINVYPERPDRAYAAYIDGGIIILDIADKAHPKMISRLDYHPPMTGFTHTVLPLFSRGLLIVTDEATRPKGEDWPKLTWVVDASEETNPVIIGSLPLPPIEKFAQRTARFGAHNIHENYPAETSFRSDDLIFGAFFSMGVRVYDVSKNPFHPEEVGYYIPPTPARVAAGRHSDE